MTSWLLGTAFFLIFHIILSLKSQKMVTVGLLARRKWPIQCGKSSMYVVELETLDIAAVELEEATAAGVH